MPVPYRLNDGEQRLAKFIATCREANNEALRKRGKIKDRKHSEGPSIDFNINAYGAEIAVCRLLNKCPDMTTHVNDGGHFDLVASGRTVDVKWRRHPNSSLLVTHWKNREGKRCDIYILVTGEIPSYVVVGYAYKEQIFKTEMISETVINPTGGQNPYEIQQRMLHPFTQTAVDDAWRSHV